MSGRVRTAFAKRGWDATSCDILPDEYRMWNPEALCGHDRTCDDAGYPCPDWGTHYQGDVLDIIEQDWDLVIAHPPCTDLSQAGARYWKAKEEDGRMQAAIEFFWKMYEKPKNRTFVVVENPVGVINSRYREPDQTVQPWWFGDPLIKNICLWYRAAYAPSYAKRGISTRDLIRDELPMLKKSNPVEPTGRVVTGGGSWRTDKAHGKTGMNRNWEDSQGRARRDILRSITSKEVAQAMAEQWGAYVESRRL